MREKWIDALRSGKYPQTQDTLRDKVGYCCLGVACEIFKDDFNLKVTRLEHIYEYDDKCASLPKKLREALGLTKKQEYHLIEMNDTGSTFEEIADYIENLRS